MTTATPKTPVITGEGIQREIIEMLLDRKMFYGHFLQQMQRHNIDATSPLFRTIGTLSVSINQDLKPNIWINVAFYNPGDYDANHPQNHTWGMTQDERMALLEHEIMHVLMKHLIRKEGREDYIWNLAADLAINQFIKNLPRGAVCPVCNVFVRKRNSVFPTSCPLCSTALDDKKDICEPLDISNFDIGGKVGKIKFDSNKPTEYYYDVLWQKLPKQVIQMGGSMTGKAQQNAKNQMGGGGSPGDGDGDGSEQGSGGGGDQQQDQGGGGHGERHGSGMLEIDGMKVPMPLDSHEVWATGADNKEMAHEKIKEMCRNAMHKVNEKSQGYLPDHIRGLVEAVLAHKVVNWKSELRKFVGYEEFANFVSSRKRLNRRFPIVQPGYMVQRQAHFVVVCDSSGSVSDEEYGKFWKEVGVMHAAKITITYVDCDADVQRVTEYKKMPERRKNKVGRVGYGGTDFRPPFQLVADRKYTNHQGQEFKVKKVDGVIYLTDGYGTFPEKITCPTIWVMLPNHSTNGMNDRNLGKVIVMKD